jgi:hypothetical protein
MANPKCFISYSWDNEEHKKWVLNLATKLQANGVETSLDQWDTYPGIDLTKYMETCVRESDFVAMICTPTYAVKANEGKGGVGYEKTIITGEIFETISSPKKFIPVLRNGTPKDALPSFLKSKLFIDFRKESEFQSNIEELLRHIHQKPKNIKPPLGSKPSFAENTLAKIANLYHKKTTVLENPKNPFANSSAGKSPTASAKSKRVVDADYLFRYNDGFQYFARKNQTIKEEIQSLSKKALFSSDDSLKSKLKAKYTIQLIEIKKDIRSNNGDVSINIRNDQRFGAYWRRDEDLSPVFKKAKQILIHLPFSGDQELFSLKPSTFTLGNPMAEITKNELLFTIDFFSDVDTTEQVEGEINNRIELIKRYVGWLNNDIMSFNNSLESLIGNSIVEMRKKLSQDEAILGKLGVSKDMS